MTIGDEFGKKATDAAAKAVGQAKILSEMTKRNSLISDEEQRIVIFYQQLGKRYYEIHVYDYEETFAEIIASITTSKQRIQQYSQEILDLKGVSRCGECGTEIPPGAAFCSVCGTKTSVDTCSGRKCRKCGEAADEGMHFCSFCGNPLDDSIEFSPEMPSGESELKVEKNIGCQSKETTNICPRCGEESEPGMRFCTACGEPLAEKPDCQSQTSACDEGNLEEAQSMRKCPNCGAEPDNNDVFCSQCGERL